MVELNLDHLSMICSKLVYKSVISNCEGVIPKGSRGQGFKARPVATRWVLKV